MRTNPKDRTTQYPKRGGPVVSIPDRADAALDPIAVVIGARIREARINKGLTLSELATQSHVPDLQSVEAGKRRVDAEQLWDISQCLDRQVSFFFSDNPEDKAPEPARH